MLDTENKVPLYYQLVRTLENQIESEMQINERLPSEKDICEMYSVSRTTVRLALAELEKMGYIYRIQGKGSFVSTLTPQAANSFFMIGEIESEIHLQADDQLVSQLRFCQKETAPLNICHEMGLVSDQTVIHMRYLHLLDNAEVISEDFYFKNRLFHSLPTILKEEKLLPSALKKVDFSVKTVEEFYQLVYNEAFATKCMEIKKKDFDATNEVIILNQKQFLSDKVCYHNFSQNS